MDALDYRSQQHLNMMIMSGRPSTDFAGGFAAARLGRPLTKYPAGGDGRGEQFRSQRWMLGGSRISVSKQPQESLISVDSGAANWIPTSL